MSTSLKVPPPVYGWVKSIPLPNVEVAVGVPNVIDAPRTAAALDPIAAQAATAATSATRTILWRTDSITSRSPMPGWRTASGPARS